MVALIKRQLWLYLRNYSGVIFSLMGALISFVLYLLFLKHSMQPAALTTVAGNQLLDAWLIGGTLTITGITTTLTGLTQLVADRETAVRADLLQSDIGLVRLTLSYVLSAIIIGIGMQLAMLLVMLTYFKWTDGLTFSWGQLGQLSWLIVLGAVMATLINAILLNGIRKMASLSSLTAVVGTGAGFLVGGLIPIGSLPTLAQQLVKLTPGSYVAALMRQVLMHPQLQTIFSGHRVQQAQFETKMGVRLGWSVWLTTGQTYQIIGLVLLTATCFAFGPQWWLNHRRQAQFSK